MANLVVSLWAAGLFKSTQTLLQIDLNDDDSSSPKDVDEERADTLLCSAVFYQSHQLSESLRQTEYF